MPAPVAIYCPSPTEGRLHQGEVLSSLVQMKVNIDKLSASNSTEPTIDRIVHPFAIIVSQDCDLEQDFNSNSEGKTAIGQLLPSILFCEVGEADKVRSGPPSLASDIWRRVKSNKDERYQFLQKVAVEQDGQGRGLPALALDFKRYFTIPTDEVYFRLKGEAKRHCVLVSPYLQNFINRFFHFQMRVALPVEHVGD